MFRSGAQEFGEPGWWKLVQNRPPTLRPDGDKSSTPSLKNKGGAAITRIHSLIYTLTLIHSHTHPHLYTHTHTYTHTLTRIHTHLT